MNLIMHNYLPKKILVTGGAGFIGSNYIRYVLAHDAAVVVVNLDKLTYAGSLANLKQLPDEQRHHFIHGDICDRDLVDSILRQHEIDTIVHFAAESHVDRSITGPAAFIQTNVVGTFTLLEAARQYWLLEKKLTPQQCRFHHVSTDEVYGSLTAHAAPFSETTPYAPNSPYSASKAGSDHLVRAYYSTYQLPVTLTNCSNNYGPYQHTEKFIPTVIRACLQSQPIPVYGDGSNIRDWLYVEDHCAALQTVICKGKLGENYNIGGENELSNIALVEKICSLMDAFKPKKKPHKQLITYVTDRPGHDWRYAIDANKLKATGLWQMPQQFDVALTKTVEFYSND